MTLRRLAGFGLALALLCASAAARAAYDDASLIAAFAKTVFGAEGSAGFGTGTQVRKFEGPVRVFIDQRAAIDRKADVARFVAALPGLVSGLDIRVVGQRGRANFRVFIVDRKDYADVVRNDIYGGANRAAPGRCFVLAISNRGAIESADAVIVSDEGEFLFRRCLIEEVLQGLGPLNDSPDLRDSVFNDSSYQADFTLTDRFILNMLYDRRIRAGMSIDEATGLLPFLLPEIRRRVGVPR